MDMKALAFKPNALWKLDGTSPFQDYSGYSRSATVSGTERHGLAVAADATYSQIVGKSNVITMASPVFTPNEVNKEWSIGACVSPLQRNVQNAPQAYRENLWPNPSFAVDTSTWFQGGQSNSTITRSTAQQLFGSGSLLCTANAAGDFAAVTTTGSPNLPAGTYTISCYVYVPTGSPDPLVQTFGSVGGTGATARISIKNAWTRITQTITTTSAGQVGFAVLATATAAGQLFYVDAVQMEVGSTATTYFDGSFIGCEWAGTANNSLSRLRADISAINYAPNPNVEGSLDVTSQYGGGYSFDTSAFKFGTRSTSNTATVVPTAMFLRQELKSINIPNNVVYASVWVYVTEASTASFSVNYVKTDGTNGFISTAIPLMATNTWVNYKLSGTLTNVKTISNMAFGVDYFTNAASKMYTDGWLLSNSDIAFFDGTSSSAGWSGTANDSPSLFYLSQSPQQIISNLNVYDGLSINNTVVTFSTTYTSSGTASCSYDLQELRRFEVFGIHSPTKNSLFIDGTLVAEVDISSAQQNDTMVAANTNLYSGNAVGSSELLINMAMIYSRALQTEEIVAIYKANSTVAVGSVPKMFGGDDLFLSTNVRPAFINVSYLTDEEWADASLELCDTQDNKLVPQVSSLGVTQAGVWLDSIDLYSGYLPITLDSIVMDWNGYGETIEASIDDVTWVTVTKGVPISIIAPGFDPTNKELYIRISFNTSLFDCYVDSFYIKGYNSNTATYLNRTITWTAPAAVFNERLPFLAAERWGTTLISGTLSIGDDVLSGTAPVVKTIEVWVRDSPGTPDPTLSSSITTGATIYTNGAAVNTYPDGEWVIKHFVKSAGFTGPFTISGNATIGKVAFYPTALDVPTITKVISNYTGRYKTTQTGSSSLTIAETAVPVTIYSADWATTSSS